MQMNKILAGSCFDRNNLCMKIQRSQMILGRHGGQSHRWLL